MNRALTSLLLLVVSFSCKESSNRPVFTTGAVTVDPVQGTKLTVNISSTSDNPATDFGFIWSTASHFGTSADSVFSFHVRPSHGTYTHVVQNDLIPGATYYVVAFMKIGQSTIQANTVKFSSAGPVAPIISDFSPKQGHALDMITISGDHFNEIAKNNIVKIGNVNCKAITASRTQLVVQVPSSYAVSSAPITVQVYNNTGTSTGSFSLLGPTISGFSPASGVAGTSVTITGAGFSTIASADSVLIGGLNAVVTAASATQLTVTLPAVPLSGSAAVNVRVNGASAVAATQFTLLGPQIISFSPTTGGSGTPVTITGLNFASTVAGNKVVLGGQQAIITSASAQQIIFTVPPSIVTAGAAQLTLTSNNITANASGTFDVEGPVITGVTPSSAYGGDTIKISGRNFSPNLTDNAVDFAFSNGFDPATIVSSSLTELDVVVPLDAISLPVKVSIANGSLFVQQQIPFTQLNPWTVLQAFGGGARLGAAGFSIGSYGYVCTGTGFGPAFNDLWRYDPSTDTWSQMASFPGQGRAWAFSFSINGKGYVGGGNAYPSGWTVSATTPLTDLWEYDPVADTWTAKASLPAGAPSGASPSAAVLGGQAYVVVGTALYTYSPLTDQWSVISNYSLDLTAFTPVSLNGVIYYLANGFGFFKYDPVANLWTRMPDLNFDAGGRGWIFAVNNKLYTGVNSQFNTPEFDIYRYDELNAIWVRCPSNPYDYPTLNAACFTIQGSAYFATGDGGGNMLNSVLRFTPNR